MLSGLYNLQTFDSPELLSRAAAERVLSIASHNLEVSNRFNLALSGGSTPERLYRLLADTSLRQLTDWAHWHVFFGDERCVAQDHAESNYRLAREALLDHVPIPASQVHPMVVDPGHPEGDACAYEALIRREVSSENRIPVFDLVLLGLGPDGHTASLFPDTDALGVRDRLVTSVRVDRLSSTRITFTYPLLDHARHILFLVTGQAKAPLLAELQDGSDEPRYPVQRLAPQGTVEWFLDRAAASELT